MRTTLLLTTLLAAGAFQSRSGYAAGESAASAVATTSAAASATSSPQRGCAARPEIAAVRAEIERVRRAWVEATERDDATALAQLYAVDGVVIDPPDYEPIQGREAIRKVLAAELPIVGRLDLRSQDFHACGDLAYDYGEFAEQVIPPGERSMKITGRYLIVLRRQKSGAWKLVKKIAMMSPRQLARSAAK